MSSNGADSAMGGRDGTFGSEGEERSDGDRGVTGPGMVKDLFDALFDPRFSGGGGVLSFITTRYRMNRVTKFKAQTEDKAKMSTGATL